MYESNAPEIIKYLTEDDLKLMYGRLNRRFVVVDALPAVGSLEPADKNVIYVVKETDGGVERYWPNVLEDNVWKPVGIVQEDLNGKIDKVSAEEGHLVVADENGNLADAGLMPGTFVALAYDPSEQIQPHATDFRKIWGALQSGIPVILLDNRESGTGLYASLNAAGYTWPDGDHMAERVTDVDTDYRPHDDSIPGYYDSENGKFYYDIYHAIEIDPVDGVVYHDLVDDKVYLYADEAFTRVLRFVQFSANELVNDNPVWTSRKAARPVFFRIFEPETSATANNFYVVYGDSASSVKVDLEKKADKVLNAVNGHFAALDSTGNLTDSGKKADDFATAAQGKKADTALQEHQDISGKADKSAMAITDVAGDPTKKNIKLKDGLATVVVTEHAVTGARIGDGENLPIEQGTIVIPESATVNDGKLSIKVGDASPVVFSANDASDKSVTVDKNAIGLGNVDNTADLNKPISTATQTALDKKADKVEGATNGNFAALDSNGNLTDSNAKRDDFATAAQGAKADTAYQKPGDGIPKSDMASDVQESLGKADSAVQSVKMGSSSGTELKDGTSVIIPEASQNAPGVMSTSDKTKLDGIETGANKYIHPSHTAHNSGMYKVTIDAQGHVSSVAAIEKSDITALGIPAQDTTYQFADDYDGTTNKGATEATVRNAVSNAINALDKTENSTGGTNIEIQIVEENGLITAINVVTDNTVNATDVNTAIETALANYGGFKVVELTSGTPPVPDVQNPSEKYIYLTKDSQSLARDPYTEWIYIKGDASANPPTQSHWEVIGETSVDLSNYIQKVNGVTENNFAVFTSDGAIKDSGNNENSFATAAQGTKADNSVQTVSINNGTAIYPDSNGKVNLPLASTTDPGAMSASDKSKLDGINNYIESATVSGRTLTLTPKSGGSAVTFNDTGDINVIEKISVNGTQQTVTNKEVDLTIPTAANNAKITLKVGGVAAGDTTPVAGDFTVDQSLDEDIVIPAAVSASGNDPAKPGVMSSADKTKLDGIANGAEVNNIESITIEGDQNPLPISSENVTIPKAAYTTGADPSYTTGAVTGQDKKKLDEIEVGAQVNDIEHIKIAGESADLAIDANKRIELPLAASATTSPVAPATPGIMSATDKEKLDTLKNFSKVQVSDGGATPTFVTPDDENSTIKFIPGRNVSITGDNTAKTVTIEATGVASTVSEGKGIKVNHTQDPTTGIDDYEVTLDNALGYLGGTQAINGVTATPLNLLSTNMQIELDSQNDRFVLYEDQTDNQVYLCALKTVANQDPLLRVNGVDVFTLTYAISISRTPDPYNSFIGQASISVSRKSSTGWFGLHGNYSSYPSITGMCDITGSVDISNMGGTDITIGGKLYQAYRLAYSGDVQGSGESISIIVRMSAKEYTTGTAEYTGAQHTYTGGEGISVNVADDTINAKVGPGLQINPTTNNIEVRTKQNGGIVIDPNDGMSIVLDTQAEEAIAIAEAVQSTIDERIITNMSFSEIHNAYSYGSSFATIGHGQFYGTLFTPVMTQEVKSNAKIGVYIRTPGNQGEIAFAIYQFDLANPGYIDLVCHTDFYWCGNLPAADGSTTSAFREFAVTYVSPTCNVMSSDKLYYSVAITRDDNNAAACAIQGFYGTSGYDSQLNGIPPLTIARPNLENLTGNNIANLTSATIHTYLGRIAKADLGSEQNSTPRVFMSIRNVPQVQNA